MSLNMGDMNLIYIYVCVCVCVCVCVYVYENWPRRTGFRGEQIKYIWPL